MAWEIKGCGNLWRLSSDRFKKDDSITLHLPWMFSLWCKSCHTSLTAKTSVTDSSSGTLCDVQDGWRCQVNESRMRSMCRTSKQVRKVPKSVMDDGRKTIVYTLTMPVISLEQIGWSWQTPTPSTPAFIQLHRYPARLKQIFSKRISHTLDTLIPLSQIIDQHSHQKNSSNGEREEASLILRKPHIIPQQMELQRDLSSLFNNLWRSLSSQKEQPCRNFWCSTEEHHCHMVSHPVNSWMKDNSKPKLTPFFITVASITRTADASWERKGSKEDSHLWCWSTKLRTLLWTRRDKKPRWIPAIVIKVLGPRTVNVKI